MTKPERKTNKEVLLENIEYEFDIKRIRDLLGIGPQYAYRLFGFGPFISRLVEMHVCIVFGGKMFKKDKGGFDAIINDKIYSVRSLTNNSNLYFQRAVFTGEGRTCTQSDLVNSIKSVHGYIINDVTCAPRIRLIPIIGKKQDHLLDSARNFEIKPGGIKKNRFYNEFVKDEEFKLIDLPKITELEESNFLVSQCEFEEPEWEEEEIVGPQKIKNMVVYNSLGAIYD